MGTIPDISVEFLQYKVLSEDEKQKILNKNKDKLILSSLLKSLFKIYKLHLGNYHLQKVRISLSIPPVTRIELTPKERGQNSFPK